MIALTLVLACGSNYDGSEAVWALNRATVTPAADGLTGAHTWSFYDSDWERTQSDDDLICEVVQELTGEVVAPMSGCPGCSATYDIGFTLVVSDCADELTHDPGIEALLGFAFGPVPDEIAEDDPWPDNSAGWYLTVDGELMEDHGFAYPSSLDRGESSTTSGWMVGETYTLDPAYAWEL